jgi:hypothetical protein
MLPFRIFKLRDDGSLHFVEAMQEIASEHSQSYGPVSTSFKMRKQESACSLPWAAKRRIEWTSNCSRCGEKLFSHGLPFSPPCAK